MRGNYRKGLITKKSTSKGQRAKAIYFWQAWLEFGESTYVDLAAISLAKAKYLESIGR